MCGDPHGIVVVLLQSSFRFDALWANFIHFLRSCYCLLCLLAYQGIVFIAFLSLCIGLATLSSYLNEVIWGYPIPPTMQSIITLATLAICGEIHVISQYNSGQGIWLTAKKKKYPYALRYIPGAIYSSLYLLAMTQLCKQYLVVHYIKSHTYKNDSTTETEDTRAESSSKSLVESMNNATFIFLLSLSYMIYLAARTNDWIYYNSRHYTFMAHRMICNIWIFCTFYIIQVALLLLYLSPVVLICVLCQHMFLEPETNFLVITGCCGMLGVIALDLESRTPFPTKPQRPPIFIYETHLITRYFVLIYGLYPLIAIPFFLSNDKTGSYFSSAETTWLIFSFCVGATFLQTIKCVVNVAYSKHRILRGLADGVGVLTRASEEVVDRNPSPDAIEQALDEVQEIIEMPSGDQELDLNRNSTNAKHEFPDGNKLERSRSEPVPWTKSLSGMVNLADIQAHIVDDDQVTAKSCELPGSAPQGSLTTTEIIDMGNDNMRSNHIMLAPTAEADLKSTTMVMVKIDEEMTMTDDNCNNAVS